MLEEGEIQQSCSNSESSDYVKTRKAGRTDLCMVCINLFSKYTCPNCRFRTCSLNCSRKHKIMKECSGLADPTKKVQKKNIDQKVVQKDFSFIKEMLSDTDKIKKCLTGVTAQIQEPKRFYFLKKQAKSLYNIRIHQAPAMMERHRDNISFYFMKTKEIYWVVEFMYFKGKNSCTRHLILPTADSNHLENIIPKDFLCPDLLNQEINTQKSEQFKVFVENRILNESSTIMQVDRSQKLSNCLLNLNIYEFPTLFLVHESLVREFQKWKKIR